MMSPLLHWTALIAPSTSDRSYNSGYQSSGLPFQSALGLLQGTAIAPAEHTSHVYMSLDWDRPGCFSAQYSSASINHVKPTLPKLC